MWEIDNKLQIISLAQSFGLGVFYCLFYDFFKAMRLTTSINAKAIFFQDIVYFAVISPITFCFLLSVTNGEIRGYVFILAGLGFFITRQTFSRIWLWVLKAIFKIVFRIYRFIKNNLDRLYNLIFRWSSVFIKFWQKNLERIKNCFKKGLKKR